MKISKHIDLLIICFIFIVLFALPAIFVRIDHVVSWKHVIKIWQDQILLLPLFAFNHWFLLPRLMLRKKYLHYFMTVAGCIALIAILYYHLDKSPDQPIQKYSEEVGKLMRNNRPTPIPPYANLLMYSLLIVGVDTGLFFSRRWHKNEEQRRLLEHRNTVMELEMLKNQVSPHFFMNTLNNIYSLIERDALMARSAIMQLSKLMRYLLYENTATEVSLDKEFEFIRSYVDLMRLRFTDEVEVELKIPSEYKPIQIPPMLFISYIENAFKYGVSYKQKSFVRIVFEVLNDHLIFKCSNSCHDLVKTDPEGGIGLRNSRERLSLLYGDKYSLNLETNGKTFDVILEIPVI